MCDFSRMQLKSHVIAPCAAASHAIFVATASGSQYSRHVILIACLNVSLFCGVAARQMDRNLWLVHDEGWALEAIHRGSLTLILILILILTLTVTSGKFVRKMRIFNE